MLDFVPRRAYGVISLRTALVGKLLQSRNFRVSQTVTVTGSNCRVLSLSGPKQRGWPSSVTLVTVIAVEHEGFSGALQRARASAFNFFCDLFFDGHYRDGPAGGPGGC